MDRYPYFVYPLLSRLRDCGDPEEAERLRVRIAVNVGDPEALAAITGAPDLRAFNSANVRREKEADPLDAFISRFGAGKAPDLLEEMMEPVPIDEDPASAALEEAKILVKKGDYDRALAIMEHFYLNNPKKSLNFADQIRFVRKLMLNESRKSR